MVADVDAVEVELGTASGYLLADDLDAVSAVEQPWVALLPALDSTVMGWKERDWYLSEHGAALFDRNGNAGPTVWCVGRIVGGWAQRKDGKIEVRLLDRLSDEPRLLLESERERLEHWLGEVRNHTPIPDPAREGAAQLGVL